MSYPKIYDSMKVIDIMEKYGLEIDELVINLKVYECEKSHNQIDRKIKSLEKLLK